MVTDARLPSPDVRFDDDEVDTQGQTRISILGQEPGRRPTQLHALAMVNRLLADPEVTLRPEAHLHDDQVRGRTRVGRHEIEFAATDMDVPGQDAPSRRGQAVSDQRLGGVAGHLCRCPCAVRRCRAIHADDAATRLFAGTRAPLHSGLSRASDAQRLRVDGGEIEPIKHGVVGHDRDPLAVQQRVRGW